MAVRSMLAAVVTIPVFTAAAALSGGAGSQPAAASDRFPRTVRLETQPATSANVSLGDLNGDRHLDAVLAKGRHWPLVDRVLFGDGTGAFTAGTDLGPASDRSYSGLLVDLDQDGDLDVVISNDTPDPKRTYLNDGAGRFTPGSTFGRPGWSTRNASVADLDGDGLPDIVVANRTGDTPGANYVCVNRGGGRFDADCTLFSKASATTITPADVTGDGLIDLIVPHRDGGQSYVHVHEPGKAVAFRPVPFGPPDAAIRVSQAADFDSDGHVDIVVIDERRGVAIYYGDGQGRFALGPSLEGGRPTPYALAVGDLDRDGRSDIVVGHVEAPSTLYVNDGTGRRFAAERFGDSQGTVYGFSIGDIDEDGRPDIAAARSDAVNVAYLTAAR
jgi:FG-GAP-like repeat